MSLCRIGQIYLSAAGGSTAALVLESRTTGAGGASTDDGLIGRVGDLLHRTGSQRFGHAHGVIVRFNFGQGVNNLLLARRFDALGQMPTAIREVRALKNCESRAEADGGRGFGVFQ